MTTIPARPRQVITGLVLLAATVATGAFSLGFAPAAVLPAAGAATCTASGGVSVVVDYRELGGSTVTACATDGGGKSATAVFASVGVDISYATRQPGFVCRINGVPAADPCVNASPANAYWGLWWSDGSRASWTYSSSGVGGLTVPAGGSVGWSWQQDRGGATVPPGVAPPVSQGSSTPTSSPTSTPTSSPTATPSSGSGTAHPSPTANPTASPTRGGGSPSAHPTSGSASPTTSPAPSVSATSPTDDPTLASESPGDSRSSEAGEDPALASESPGDSRSSEAGEDPALGSESPSDSTASGDSAAAGAGGAAAAEPTRVPAWITWSVVALLGVGIVVSAAISRRRRVSDAS